MKKQIFHMIDMHRNIVIIRAMDVAQLEERSLPTSEILVTNKFICYQLCWNDENIEKKWPGMSQF